MANPRLQLKRAHLAAALIALLIVVAWAGIGAARAGQGPATPEVKSSKPKTENPSSTGAQKPKARAKKTAPTAENKKAAEKPGTKKVEAAAPPKKAPLELTGRRDPFREPPVGGPSSPNANEITGPLPPGLRGLVISQLVLEGIVRMDQTNKMIAAVTNNTRRAYFLRETDVLYNGVVTKITPDAVYFQENSIDTQGKVTTREVVKRLGSGSGEGR
jgi:hypothetical protein